MTGAENSWRAFFGRFVPYVFTEGELIRDTENKMYPRITFSYQTADFFMSVPTNFQVWTWSHNNAQLLSVCDKISEAVPVGAGTVIIMPGEFYYEYRDAESGQWVRFESAEFQSLADRFAPADVEWRRNEIGSAGGIEVWRGSPFLTPKAGKEEMSRMMQGSLCARYFCADTNLG